MLDPDDDAAGVAARRSGIDRFLNYSTVRSEPRTTTIPAEGMRDPFSANRCKSKDGVCKSKSTAGMATYLRGNKLACNPESPKLFVPTASCYQAASNTL